VQSGFTVNFPHMLDEQAGTCAYILEHAFANDVRGRGERGRPRRRGSTRSSAGPVNNVKFLEACTPGYYNNEGKPGDRSVRNGSYGNGAIEFIKVLDAWRAAGTLDGLELTR
jgi:hypothetical protein